MKTFNLSKFCSDLKALRGNETQNEFAKKLGVNRSTLSLLESGKQIPSLGILNQACNIGNFQPNDYFESYDSDGLLYLMGTLDGADKDEIAKMMERICIKEKYTNLAKKVQVK